MALKGNLHQKLHVPVLEVSAKIIFYLFTKKHTQTLHTYIYYKTNDNYEKNLSSEATLKLQKSVRQPHLGGNAIFSVAN